MKFFKKILAVNLVTISMCTLIPMYKHPENVYAERSVAFRDIDGEVEFVTVAHISHQDVQFILKNWKRSNVILATLSAKYPKAVILYLISEVSSWVIEDSDKGNGLFVKRMVYTGDCTFCGGGGLTYMLVSA